jgi:hypothetical protein
VLLFKGESPEVAEKFARADPYVTSAAVKRWLTLWESLAAVRRFAGAEAEKAVVDPEAQAILTSFDESVTHFEVLHSPDGTAA